MDENTNQGEEKQEIKNETKKSDFFAKKGVKITSIILAAILALTGAFFGGFFVYKATLPAGVNSLLWAKSQIQSNYYEDVTDEEFFNAAFSGVNSMLDDYSKYMTKEEYAAAVKQAAGSYSGLGLSFLTKDEDGNACMRVIRVSGGSPAEDAGIKEGSKIVAFGKDADNLTESEIFSDFSAFLSTMEAGEEFVIKELQYPYGEDNSRVVTIYKSAYTENYVFYRTSSTSYVYTGSKATEKAKGTAIAQLPEDTAYIRLTQFNGNAAAEFDAAMTRFKADGKKNLVLDLRDNGGGDMEILCSIASYFCKNSTEKKPVVAKAIYKNGDEDSFKATGNLYNEYFGEDSKIYVLADSGTASASECLLGCMIDYGAITYETICLSYRSGVAKTYGKGIMQTTRSRYPWLSEAIKLTTAKIYWPTSNTCIHGRGIVETDGTKTASESYAENAEILAALSQFGIL